MRLVKKRKPRGRKQNGHKSYDLCTGCYAPFCDPMLRSHKFSAMAHERLEKNLCVACGHNPWTCKSSLDPDRIGREVGK